MSIFLCSMIFPWLSIDWVQLSLRNLELPHNRHDRLVSTNPHRNGGWEGTGKSYFHSPIFAMWNGTPSFNWQHQYVWTVCKKRGGLCRITESVCVVACTAKQCNSFNPGSTRVDWPVESHVFHFEARQEFLEEGLNTELVQRLACETMRNGMPGRPVHKI